MPDKDGAESATNKKKYIYGKLINLHRFFIVNC